MRLPNCLLHWLDARAMPVAASRSPDFIIGGSHDPYLRRWWVIPRNRWFNVYLHQFLRDDDDRALHDHPWFWCSIVLHNAYIEHTIRSGGIRRQAYRLAGSVRWASPWCAHRIQLLRWAGPARALCDELTDDLAAFTVQPSAPCWTLFITGPRLRNWGFHCPERGWVPWQQFTASDDPGAIGKGCDA